jgi:hypothetical protein
MSRAPPSVESIEEGRPLKKFVDPYRRERNYQGVENRQIEGRVLGRRDGGVRRRPRLGGELNYYGERREVFGQRVYRPRFRTIRSKSRILPQITPLEAQSVGRGRDHEETCGHDPTDVVPQERPASISRTPASEPRWVSATFGSPVATTCDRGARYSVLNHYNGCRPHRSLDLAPPNGRPAIESWTSSQALAVKRRDRLGGLLHEYQRVA